MTVNTQKPIVIFRGDNTAAFDLRTIKILLTGDLDLTNATARFDLLDFTKSWTTEEVATGELSIVFDSAQTKSFALGPQVGTLRLYDMSTGAPRQLTIVNKIPFFVTNRVCEIDSQSYEADVCVSGGDVIHIEFKVGAGAVEGKADKVKNATAGDLASLTADGNLEDSGIPKTDVLRKSQMDATPTAGSQNPVTSDGIKQAIDAATPSDYAQVKAQVEQNTTDITAINGKIPAQASAQNQLADKAFVNSSIATNTATFRGSYNLVSDLGLTVSATEQQVAAAIAAKLASLVPPVVPENNDYCFVQVPKTDADPTVIERVDRYKCTVTESGGVTTSVWEYEWSLNNSSFTADQWAAINSGMTAADVTKLAGIEAGAQVNAVTSVNSKTGAVVLGASDVGALPSSGGSVSGNLTVGGNVEVTGVSGITSCGPIVSSSTIRGMQIETTNGPVSAYSHVHAGCNVEACANVIAHGNVQASSHFIVESGRIATNSSWAALQCNSYDPSAKLVILPQSVGSSWMKDYEIVRKGDKASTNVDGFGIVRIGSNIGVSDGTISVPDGGIGTKGVVELTNTIHTISDDMYDGSSASAVTPRALSEGLRYMMLSRGSSISGTLHDRAVQHDFLPSFSSFVPPKHFSFPTLPNDGSLVKDFILDVELYDGATDNAIVEFLGMNNTWYAAIPEGEDWTDMMTVMPGQRVRYYFTETGFRISDASLVPVYLVARQNIELVGVSQS